MKRKLFFALMIVTMWIPEVVSAQTDLEFVGVVAGVGVDSKDNVYVSHRGNKALRLWYDEPAPDSDAGWVNRSIPMGNGYMGVNVFGGTARERIQITENSLYSSTEGRGLRRGGLNNFAEVYIDFGHNNTSNYERELNLNKGLSHVKYEHDDVEYSREYLTSYPDKVMAIRLIASKAGTLSFTLRPTIPFLDDGKFGSVVAKADTITLSGVMNYFNVKY